jgi:uncharacterized coiled-coil protein SlyX
MAEASDRLNLIFEKLRQLYERADEVLKEAEGASDKERRPPWWVVLEAKDELGNVLPMLKSLLKDKEQLRQLDELQKTLEAEGPPPFPEGVDLYEPVARSLYFSMAWILNEIEKKVRDWRLAPPTPKNKAWDLDSIAEWLRDALSVDMEEHSDLLGPLETEEPTAEVVAYARYAAKFQLAHARFAALYDKHEAAQARIAELEAELAAVRKV